MAQDPVRIDADRGGPSNVGTTTRGRHRPALRPARVLATIAVMAAPVLAGTAAGAQDLLGGLAGTNGTNGATSTAAATASPSAIYRATVQVASTGSNLTATPWIVFRDAAGHQLAAVSGQAVTATSSGWTTTVPTYAISPAGTASAAVTVSWRGSGGTLLVSDPVLTSSPRRLAPPLRGPLHTAGNRIVDATGATVVLHGIDLYELEANPAPSSLTRDTIAQLHTWGFNMVRISLGEQFLLSSSCEFRPSYVQEIRQVVDWVTSMGMLAVLDLHTSAPVVCSQPGLQEMADDPGSDQFWRQLAELEGGNPLVAFDLFNEPHDIPDNVWLHGGTATDWLPYPASGMQTLYDDIRGTGATNLVIVSGNTWANDLPATLVQGTRIVYSVHVYTCPTSPPPQCSSSTPDDPSSILDPWVGPSATVPVIVGEFGWPSADDGTYLHNVVAFAQAHGWSWDAFCFDGGDDDEFGLVAQSPLGGPYQPSPAGMPILAALQGLS